MHYTIYLSHLHVMYIIYYVVLRPDCYYGRNCRTQKQQQRALQVSVIYIMSIGQTVMSIYTYNYIYIIIIIYQYVV